MNVVPCCATSSTIICDDSPVVAPAHDGSVARRGAAVIIPSGDARDCVLPRHSDDACWLVLIRLRPIAQLAFAVVSLRRACRGSRATETRHGEGI